LANLGLTRDTLGKCQDCLYKLGGPRGFCNDKSMMRKRPKCGAAQIANMQDLLMEVYYRKY